MILNLEEEILREQSKAQVLRISAWIGGSERRMADLMELFLNGPTDVSRRAAWVIGYTSECRPHLLRPWYKKMLWKVKNSGVHPAVRRNVMKALSSADIPPPLLGTAAAIAFRELASPDSPVAVRVYSMILLGALAERKPALRHELQGTIEQVLMHPTPGLASRGRKILRRLAVLPPQ